MTSYLEKFRKMIRLRNLTKKTLYAYASYLKSYLDYLDSHMGKLPEDVTWDDLRDYIIYLGDIRKISPRTVNGHIAQLRFFYLYVLNRQWDSYQIPYQKFNAYVPVILSQHETMEFIDKIEDRKHKAIVSLMYSSGLRIGETCRLRYEDISREKMTITVNESKNRTGSIAILSKYALKILTEYWYASGKPMGWLFPGRKDSHITANTVSMYNKKHLKYLGWSKNVSNHCFRRAFGTHLFQNNVDIYTIKRLMRHKNINSTAAYIYLSTDGTYEPISPFDIYMDRRT
jgi:site-specific recombinase XerD